MLTNALNTTTLVTELRIRQKCLLRWFLTAVFANRFMFQQNSHLISIWFLPTCLSEFSFTLWNHRLTAAVWTWWILWLEPCVCMWWGWVTVCDLSSSPFNKQQIHWIHIFSFRRGSNNSSKSAAPFNSFTRDVFDLERWYFSCASRVSSLPFTCIHKVHVAQCCTGFQS